MKLNYMKRENGLFKWKQIEAVDGVVFMRYKQRAIMYAHS